MTIQFDSEAPQDVLMEREVDRAIANGCRIPRWGWPIPRLYNGATGRERVTGWQKVRIAEDLGLLGARQPCGLCWVPDAPQWHTEIYFRPLTSRPICRSCHFYVHRRFQRPEEWRARIMQAPGAAGWVGQLRLFELSRDKALAVAACADVFSAIEGLGNG